MKSNGKHINDTRHVNINFRIKVNGRIDNVKLNTLVGVSGLIDLVGEEMAEKLLERAFESFAEKTSCKLRRGIKITFYNK